MPCCGTGPRRAGRVRTTRPGRGRLSRALGPLGGPYHPAHPSLAWPVTARHDLAPAPVFYVLGVLLFAVAVPSARLALACLRRGRAQRHLAAAIVVPREAGLM